MKSTLNLIILTLIVLSLSSKVNSQNSTDVYVTAHPDDWQLFMNPNAYNSVKNNNKTIFLHTTAGDAGAGIGNNNYYLAREEGSLRAIRFMSNTFTSGAGLGANMSQSIVTINGHQILRFSYRNVIAYFLRLPDGRPNGSGYGIHNNTSLQKLYNGSITNISAIDNSTTYTSLTDLKTTIQSIVELESSINTPITFNIADNNSTINPNDHSDHIYSSLIIQDLAKNINSVTMNLFTEYHTNTKEQNVFNEDYMVSVGTWAVTTSGISDNFHSSTWDSGHNAWIGKQYFRTISPPELDSNIALNKPTSSSSHETGHPSSNAVDNNYDLNNWWGANPHSQWWMVDLEDNFDINKIVVTNYYDGTRYYKYDIEASMDGVNWSKIVDFNDNTNPATNLGNTFNVNNPSARYLRVNMNYNSANIGVHIIEFEAYGDLSSITAPSNLALNKSTSASSHESGHPSSNAVDNNYDLNNWWGANPHSQWWKVDLEGIYDINKIIITNYYDGTRYYKYDVEASIDNINWNKIIDFNDNTIPATNHGNTFNIDNLPARYLRVNMNYNSANIGVHIIEFEAYGNPSDTNPLDSPTTSKTINPSLTSVSNEKYTLYNDYNPVKQGDKIKLGVHLNTDNKASIEIYTIQGISVLRKDKNLTQGYNIIEIPSQHFSKGTYIIRVDIDNKIETKKIYIN
ncbi:discoidin domain-containing protein [Aquimarina sediminis]|uniref:discoidin domain-containing protein n=1 Tax=Aquimarina sediminis TaxID=2070536 RepID=UPI000CA00BF1|nr:discoidin domain-containing protein [Aquimarina sediminis]